MGAKPHRKDLEMKRQRLCQLLRYKNEEQYILTLFCFALTIDVDEKLDSLILEFR